MGGKKKYNFLNSGCKRKISRIDFKLLQKGTSLRIAASEIRFQYFQLL